MAFAVDVVVLALVNVALVLAFFFESALSRRKFFALGGTTWHDALGNKASGQGIDDRKGLVIVANFIVIADSF